MHAPSVQAPRQPAGLACTAAGASVQPDVLPGLSEVEFYQVRHSLAPGLRAVAILNGRHDSIGKDREFSSNGSHTLLELRHVWGVGQHI